MKLSSELRSSLAMVAGTAADARDPWWIIGSAAVALHGADAGEVHDIDLLMSANDAAFALRQVGGVARSGVPSKQFRSDVFGTWEKPPVRVEIFGGFSVATDEGWSPMLPASRVMIHLGGAELFVPSADELVRLLMSFGRPKDLSRADALRTATLRNSPTGGEPSGLAK